MKAIVEQLSALKLHGMAQAVTELLASKRSPSLTTALKQLIDAERVERDVRSTRYQMSAAKLPHHKNFATFDYAASAIEQTTVQPLCAASSHKRHTI